MKGAGRDLGKAAGLLLVGVAVAGLGYPLLHELGHVLAAAAVGARVEAVQLLPHPQVLCDVRGVSPAGQVVIGLGGLVCPVVAAGWKTTRFWGWYVAFLLKGISLYAALLSLVAVGLSFFGIWLPQEDAAQIIRRFPAAAWPWLGVLAVVAGYVVGVLRKEKPLERCLRFFDQTADQTAKKGEHNPGF